MGMLLVPAAYFPALGGWKPLAAEGPIEGYLDSPIFVGRYIPR